MHQVILYMAQSADGYIADARSEVAWLDPYNPGGTQNPDDEEYGSSAFLGGIDGIIMGRKTYEQMLGFGPWPYPNKKTYVLTPHPLTKTQKNVHTLQGTPPECLAQIDAGTLWLFGGAEVVRAFHAANLINTCILTTMPVRIGAGLSLSLTLMPPTWVQTNELLYSNGAIQTTWEYGPATFTSGEF